MTPPALALQRFGAACLLGVGLGLWYDFLRPLRPRNTALSDLVFLAVTGWVWLFLALRVCGGDLRVGYSAGLAVGGLMWELTAGRLLRPVFRGFWCFMKRIWTLALWLPKKILEFLKILFASGQKWVTIYRNGSRMRR